MKSTENANLNASSVGRPRKFAEPSRPVTVTLPTRILRMLDGVSPDRARAITRVTETALAAAPAGDLMRVEVVEVAPGIGLIIVGRSERLLRLPWLRLAEIAPGRHIITILPGTSIEQLEVAISDILEEIAETDENEGHMLADLLRWIRTLRRSYKITKAELLFVSTQRGRADAPPPGTSR